MATHFNYDCPRCQSRGAGFEIRYQWPFPHSPHYANLLAVCGVCKAGMTVLSYYNGGAGHPSLMQHDLPYPGTSFDIAETWPKFDSRSPADIPENVRKFYEQGLENLATGRWDAAGAMFRKSLDVATKLLAPEHRTETLYSRINKMVEAGALTSSMGEWSHEIRLEGNNAVHDEEPETEEDARVAHKFAEAVLTYAFTLPQMVSKNRAKREPAQADAAVA